MASSISVPHRHVSICFQVTHILACPGWWWPSSDTVKNRRGYLAGTGDSVWSLFSIPLETVMKSQRLRTSSSFILFMKILPLEIFFPFLQTLEMFCEWIDSKLSPYGIATDGMKLHIVVLQLNMESVLFRTKICEVSLYLFQLFIRTVSLFGCCWVFMTHLCRNNESQFSWNGLGLGAVSVTVSLRNIGGLFRCICLAGFRPALSSPAAKVAVTSNVLTWNHNYGSCPGCMKTLY